MKRQKISFVRAIATIVCAAAVPCALAVPVVSQPGFETPVQPGGGFNGFEQANGTGNGTLAGSAWTFSPTAGISRNGSAFQGSGETAPEGQQIALIQAAGNISQTLSGFVPGQPYSITYASRSRQAPGGDTDVRVLIDGTPISGGLVRQEGFLDHTSATFIAGSASPTITLLSNNPVGGDKTLFLDNIRVNDLGVPAGPTLSNPSFEAGTPSTVFPQYGVVDGWDALGGGTGTNGAGGPFLNGAPIPDGSRIGFIQRDTGGVRALTQTVTGLEQGKAYTVQYFENERGLGGAIARPSVTLDGTPIVAERDVVRTDAFRRVVSDSFVATGASAMLSLRNNVGTGDNTALFDNLMISRAVPIIADGGFENPVQPPNQWEQANGTGAGTLAGSQWDITGAAGITRNISAFQNGGIPAPEGSQHALIQGTGSVYEDNITGFEIGEFYSLSLLTMARQGQNFGNDLEVVLDAGLASEIVLIDIPEVTFSAFTEVTSDMFRATKPSYSLTLRASLDGGNLTGDRTTFIDDVHFNFVSVPEPATGLLGVLGVAAVTLRRRRRA